MTYRVISTFLHRPSGEYVTPGEPCPQLDAETAARLVKAGCLRVDETAGARADASQPASSPATPAAAAVLADGGAPAASEVTAAPKTSRRARRGDPAAQE